MLVINVLVSGGHVAEICQDVGVACRHKQDWRWGRAKERSSVSVYVVQSGGRGGGSFAAAQQTAVELVSKLPSVDWHNVNGIRWARTARGERED